MCDTRSQRGETRKGILTVYPFKGIKRLYPPQGIAMRLLAPTPSQLAAVLRGRRQALGLTQREAGGKVGLLQKTVSALESDPSGSSVASLFKLLSALELDVVVEPRQSTRISPADQEW
jgi:HTH-type transcriptional regulator / antitoxin HipB